MDELEKIRKKKMEELMKKVKGDQTMTDEKNKIEINDDNFEKEVIEKSKQIPVVVDFWATWCGPCLMLGPVLEKMVDEFDGKFILAKLDATSNPKTSQEYEIRSIPAVKLFKDGKVFDEFIGALPESQLRAWFNKNFNSN